MPEARAEAISPDGTVLAYLSNASGTHQVWRRDLPGGGELQLTDMPERIGGLAFSPVSRDLVITMDRGGDERHQLWLIRDAAGAPQPLTQDPASVHAWGCWSPDGKNIAYSCNARNKQVMDVMMMNLETRAPRCVREGAGWCVPQCFTPDGQGLVIREAVRGAMDQALWLVDLASGDCRLLMGGGDGGGATAILAARFARDDRRLHVLCDRNGGFHALHALDPDSGATRLAVGVPGQDIEHFALSPRLPQEGTVTLAYVANDAGYSRLHLTDLSAGTRHEIALPAPGVVTSLRFLPDGSGLLMSFETVQTPSAVWRYDVQKQRFDRLAGGPPGGIHAEDMSAPEILEFTGSDGTVVSAFVYRPNLRSENLPVLFIVHGGPEAQWRPAWRGDLHHYLDRGYLVIAPNVRGSTGYGRGYHQLDDRERRLDAVRDLCEMAETVAGWPEVDAGRIGVMGQSYGGYMMLAAMYLRPDLWKTGATLYGLSNFITFMRTTGPWRRALRTAEYGAPETMGAFLDAISPVHHLESVAAPVLLVHATEDPRVSIEQSEQVYAILRGLGRHVEFLRVTGEGHGFARHENRVAVFERIARFLEETL